MKESEQMAELLKAPASVLDVRARLYLELAQALQRVKELEEEKADLRRELTAALELT